MFFPTAPALLDQVVAEHQEVELGSYPKWKEPRYRTQVTFDGERLELVHAGSIDLITLLRAMTVTPARLLGLEQGRLVKGAPADLVLFDPEKVAAGELRRVNDMPGGADRLVVDATGIDLVVVNGVIIRRDGRDTVSADDPLPGRLLRHGSAASATA